MTVRNVQPQAIPGTTEGIFPAACPSRTVLDHVTSKWGVLVLLALSRESHRWGELRRGIEGISEKMLAQTLRTLERDGFVLREAQAVIPPRVDYSLTARGRELSAHLLPLMSWIDSNAAEILASEAPPTTQTA
ncbi:winged helix-turn-helix transcriptional regulator [Microterricola pindariensis]|uniref:Transcriptional regulator n=1 Tax=Microterricola pindariensis TaxID=478010 RepID=A0ABX5ATC0_9MICO|nr:helix-turn-helix domain-containing protein [Microterricola pindariensis]PPL16615.1 transcriptional regulator [Microterricola pindariensis]